MAIDSGAGVVMPHPGADALRAVEVVSGMATTVGGTLYTLARTYAGGVADAPVMVLTRTDLVTGATTTVNVTLPPNDPAPPQQFTALVAAPGWANPPQTLLPLAVTPTPLVVVAIAPGAAPYTFLYQVRLLDPATGSVSAPVAASVATDTFVNVFDATAVLVAGTRVSGESPPPRQARAGAMLPPPRQARRCAHRCAGTAAAVVAVYSQGTLTFLAGDENNLVQLDALLYTATWDVAVGGVTNMTAVPQDVSRYTLSNLAVDQRTGIVYGVSPGLYGATAYSLVTVNVSTGAVSTVGGGLVPSGMFRWTYGGNVYGETISADGKLYHVFRRAIDGAYVMAAIDVASGGIVANAAPTLLNGVNSQLEFHTFVRGASV